MALKQCRECGKEVSTRAKTCPHCGNRHPTSSMSKGAKIGVGLLGFIALAWMMGTVATAFDDSVPYTTVERWAVGRVLVIDPADRTEDRLRQLCGEIRADRRNASHATVLVFDDPDAAALRQDPRMESNDPFPEHDDHLVATYSKNTTSGFHECAIMLHGAAADSGRITLQF
jgi:hypothetical protein